MLGACAHNEVPDVAVYKEIPFLDAPEGISINTVSPIEKILGPEEWAKKQPELLCVDAQGWYEIKRGWLTACRMAGKDCNVQVSSVERIIRELDHLAEMVLLGKSP